jgi:DNA modification methylase
MRWPAERVERRSLASLQAYSRNARTHSEEQIGQIAASMRRWGWTVPILVDESGVVIAGHGRVLAAQSLGLTEAPVMVALGWSEAEKRAYRLADNQLTLNGGWDLELLTEEMRALRDWEFDLQLLGFSDIDGLLQGKKRWLTDPDVVPEAPAVATSVAGDVWRLGRHRLVCGDSTSGKSVERALGAVAPHLMVTDPPYGVEYDPQWRLQAGLAGTGSAAGKIENDNRCDWREAWRLFPGAVAYVWHSGLHSAEVQQSLEAVGFRLRAQIVWVKIRPVVSRGHYHWQHEPLAYVTKDGADDQWRFVPEHEIASYAVLEGERASWGGGRKQSTVWHIEHVKSDTGHGAQKPVECMKRPIENNSSPGQAVYDPFVGSGTTIIAAEITSRACHAIEINPVYVDVSVMRWQSFTGEHAKLEGTDEDFETVQAKRAA